MMHSVLYTLTMLVFFAKQISTLLALKTGTIHHELQYRWLVKTVSGRLNILTVIPSWPSYQSSGLHLLTKSCILHDVM